ncbi:hypothetical protein GGX14DRAFT_598749 [Mycena pura]|uniref:DUF6699 domain-containing protein n=1 Tax=Mycena pura TaxID=153505 RepID=A0AAD6VN35_9AGAR|nr:hypothetical protein GGX14DRAFT_598749 [Mycena pura]
MYASKIPPTPKIGNVSLPNPNSPSDDNDGKIFGGSRKRLTSFFGKVTKIPNAGVSRSMTPAPVPVTRHEYPQPGPSPRPRATSMTNRPFATQGPAFKTTIAPGFSEPARGGSFNVRQYPTAAVPQSASWVPRAAAERLPIVASGKHQGPDTPKYMKATVKEVATKEESIVLSWPLVPFADRRHSKRPLLYYDMAFDPRDANSVKDNRRAHFLALPDEDRELPVSTHCKVTEMIIDCPLVGSLVVTRPEGLRCIDVFYAIYCKYQKKPRSQEMPADKAKYLPAFEQRCRDCPGLSEYNRSKVGFLRVDLLRGKRIFDGLRRINGRWELLIDAPPSRRQT